MKDYLKAGHMKLILRSEGENSHHYYIPYHYVLRPENSTTKLRVVFNASSRTSADTLFNACNKKHVYWIQTPAQHSSDSCFLFAFGNMSSHLK